MTMTNFQFSSENLINLNKFATTGEKEIAKKYVLISKIQVIISINLKTSQCIIVLWCF